jgi:uncharacterized membrane-anchored protein
VKRLFFFLLKLAILVALALWLADRPGTAHLIWHGYVIETSAAFIGLCVLAAGFVFYFFFPRLAAGASRAGNMDLAPQTRQIA